MQRIKFRRREGALGADRRQIPFISLVPFLLIAFGLAWGILALFIFLPDQTTEIFGELTGQHPLFFLAVEEKGSSLPLTLVVNESRFKVA